MSDTRNKFKFGGRKLADPTKRINAGAHRQPKLRNAQTEIKLRGKKLKQRKPKPTFKFK